MQVPPNLLQRIASGDCVLFVGAGLSQSAGLPNWKQLLIAMLRRAEAEGLEMPDKSDIQDSIEANKFLVAAEELVERMGEAIFHKFISEVFCDPNLEPTETHSLITRIPFSSIVTTNYDRLIERAFESAGEEILAFTHGDTRQLSNALQSKKRSILKAHGTCERPETVVLTRGQYNLLIHANPAYRAYLSTLLSTKTLLFLGFSLSDPDLELLIAELRSIFENETTRHYALMSATNLLTFERKRWESDYNIEILTYTPSTAEHPEVKEFLVDITKSLPKYILMDTVNERLKSIKGVLEADSHYRIVMDTDNVFTVREKYEGASKDSPLVHSFQLEFDTNTVEGRKAYEDYERHTSTGEKITLSNPQVKNFIVPEILKPFVPEVIEKLEVTIGPTFSDKSLAVNLIFEPIEGPSQIISNLILKSVQHGEHQAVLTNEGQDSPWKVRQVWDFVENTSEIKLNFTDEGLNVKPALEAWRVVEAISKGGRLRIESVTTGKQLGEGEIQAGAFRSPNALLLRTLEALILIQSKTDATFERPANLNEQQFRIIFFLEDALKTGRANFNASEMVVSADPILAKRIYESLEASGEVSFDSYVDGYGAKLFGEFVDLGPVVIKRRMRAESDELRGLKEFLDTAGSYQIRLLPHQEGSSIGTFIDLLSDGEREEVLNSSFVRINSLQALTLMLFNVATSEDSGHLDVAKFVALLVEARAQNEGAKLRVNLLSECSADEFKQGLLPVLSRLTKETQTELNALLLEGGFPVGSLD